MMAIKARLLFWRSARWSSDTFPAPINKWWNSFLCQFWSDLQKTSQMASPFDRRKKKKNPCDVIYSFCGRLVPYWIMKAATEDFCLRRSIGCFHCHNTRRRSETGIWQMACHLRQCDAARARVDALLHDFSNLGVIKCEKQSEMCAVCVRTRLCFCTRERGSGAEWGNMNTCTQRGMLEGVWYAFILPPKKPLVLAVLQHTLLWLLYWFN